MAFTEKDLEVQQKQFADLKERFSRLVSQHENMIRDSGLTEEEMNIDFDSLTPAGKEFVEKAKKEAIENAQRLAAQARATSEFAQVSPPSKRNSSRRNAVTI